ncbi:nucleoside-diphosphate kinase [Hyphomicrobium sp.]|uniref:nucleoside-diphosphate kinase n=1 Tax=Hyphomicrobium sp. TaxID=82 RepID=UPI0025BD1A54|nr:nucleoside-diphosphate kinase [Hyphomicrobium sp.]MCC7253201.1 nucleoside-diphosphate kinase [Hyphomicrobium sp.]
MTFPHCHLTAKDSAYLRSLLASKDYGEPYLQLLRRKLADATLMLDHTIDRRIATIDSRVEFRVGDGAIEHRVLTRNEESATQGLALPITTLRGLALLGLRENDVFSLRKPNGAMEAIRLIKIAYQPEAARRAIAASAVVPFQPHWLRSLSKDDETGSDPHDDDPGPGAA